MSETKTRIVTVGSVQTKTGQSGDRSWRRYSLLDPDDKFVASTFSGSIGKFLQDHEGKAIEVDIEEKQGEQGTLRDLLAAREVTAAQKADAGPTPAAKHSTIVKEVALKAAVAYVATYKETEGVDAVLIVATKFEAWLNGQE